MFKDRCYKGGKRHNFEPRYSRIKNVNSWYWIYNPYDQYDEIYEGDVCSWCGKTIKKKNNESR